MHKFFFAHIVLLITIIGCSPKLNVSAKADVSTVKLPEKIKFSSDHIDAESVEWNFGDGNISTERNPSHQIYKIR
jgi:PKD repeat protein